MREQHPITGLNDGVKILLKRMDSHPHEFHSGGGWDHVLKLAFSEKILTPQEQHKLTEKLALVRRQHFYEEVCRRIMNCDAAPKQRELDL